MCFLYIVRSFLWNRVRLDVLFEKNNADVLFALVAYNKND